MFLFCYPYCKKHEKVHKVNYVYVTVCIKQRVEMYSNTATGVSQTMSIIHFSRNLKTTQEHPLKRG